MVREHGCLLGAFSAMTPEPYDRLPVNAVVMHRGEMWLPIDRGFFLFVFISCINI